MSPESGRVYFDISSLARWTGPSVGIARVERKLALWASAHLPGIQFVLFDPVDQNFRAIDDHWCEGVLHGTAVINFWRLPDAVPQRSRRTDRIPARIKPVFMWILQLRRSIIFALERVRISTAKSWLRRSAELLQGVLMSEKYRRLLTRTDERRVAFIPYDLAVGDIVKFRRNDLLVCTGAAWFHTNVAAIKRLKERWGFRFAIFCYDIIPLMFPQYYLPHDVDGFRRHYHMAFPVADLVLFSARQIETDARAYCAAHGLAIGETRVVPLGADTALSGAEIHTSLPAGLEREHFALFVSTIEPRKGHRLLYKVWLRLLADDVPQKTGFKLVFVGRPGWMTEDLMELLKNDLRLAGTIVMLPHLDDEQLAKLYTEAAFCLYPSLYEGYGLPIVEAFFHGKAVLASTGGAIPEVVGEFSPCLDPEDTDAWYFILKQWILEPEARAHYEVMIRQRFRHPTWSEAASKFFEVIESTLNADSVVENQKTQQMRSSPTSNL